MYAPSVDNLIAQLARLPGVGRRTAQRLAFHLLKASEADANALADAIREVKERIRPCSRCFNLAEEKLCEICADMRRDGSQICVVEVADSAGATITEDGLGGEAAMRLFADVLAPSIISIDNPRFLAFIPAAPTELSMMFDLVVGASSIYAGTWMEASGAVYAENQALDWLARLAGMPESTAGCFVSGGTIGNLSALLAARHAPPAAGRGGGGAHQTGRLSRGSAGQRVEPVGLPRAPEPPRPRPAVLVLARRARDAGIRRGDRAYARGRPPGRGRDPGAPRRRAPE